MGLFHQPVNSQHLEQVTDKCSFTQPQILAQHLLTHQGTDRSTCRNGAAHRETGPLKTSVSGRRNPTEHCPGRCGLKSSPTTRSSEPLLIT